MRLDSMRWLGIAALIAIPGCGPKQAELVARGTVEVPQVDVSAAVAARVVSVRVEEGALVAAGDTLALLTQADLPASVAAQRARVAMAAANVRDLETGARPEEIKRAEAEVAGAVAEAERTAADQTRFETLFRTQVISRQQLDNARAATRVASERRRSAEQALALVQAGARKNQISAARAELANAEAALRMVEARAADLVLAAPVAAQVLTRQAEPGEVLAAGVPALTLGEIGRPYVRVYVPARQLASLAIGDVATVSIDGTTTVLGKARIVAINSQAEFTPRVALTEQERADLMFGVKLDLLPPLAGVHPGLWVAVRFAAPSPGPTP